MPDAHGSGIGLRVLGAVEFDTSGRGTAPQAGRATTLLSLLAMEPGRVVSVDRMMQQLWGDDLPASGRTSLYAYISRLRGQLEPMSMRIAARAPGYTLLAPVGAIDAQVFTGLVDAADEHAGSQQWEQTLAAASEALSLWRGEPFGGALDCDDLDHETKRLERLEQRARELGARALLATGRPAEALRRARELIARDALNETYWRLRVRAEHADGHTAAALATYDEFRRLMRDELGVDPSERMRALHREILESGGPPDDPEPREAPSPAPAAPVAASLADPPITRPVGRSAELAELDRVVADVLAARGRTVVIDGEPGIGKTRLAQYAADTARRDGVTVLWARALFGAGTPPLWVWEQILDQLGRTTGATGPEASPLRLLTDDGDVGDRSELARFRFYQRVADEVLIAAAQTPLLLVIDDLQWADDGTLATLRLLTHGLAGRSCAVVATTRPRTGGGGELAGAIARD
ncbi:MAG: BTAD domain-containing putative transcriptional regulator, partial [Gordonia sp. (in: high G+C Gram-positive bacteria)]